VIINQGAAGACGQVPVEAMTMFCIQYVVHQSGPSRRVEFTSCQYGGEGLSVPLLVSISSD
jgi:hypothetical protein